jgi:hypothetical protein
MDELLRYYPLDINGIDNQLPDDQKEHAPIPLNAPINVRKVPDYHY